MGPLASFSRVVSTTDLPSPDSCKIVILATNSQEECLSVGFKIYEAFLFLLCIYLLSHPVSSLCVSSISWRRTRFLASKVSVFVEQLFPMMFEDFFFSLYSASRSHCPPRQRMSSLCERWRRCLGQSLRNFHCCHATVTLPLSVSRHYRNRTVTELWRAWWGIEVSHICYNY